MAISRMTENIIKTGAKHHPPALRLACRRAYVHGEGTLPQIAAKHGLKSSTLHRWAVEEGWGKLREAWVDGQKRRDESLTNPSPIVSPPPLSADFVATRLTRVRTQLDRLDELMMTECEPQKLDRLASAQARLAEQERVMSGRPLPGSRRPEKEAPKSHRDRFVEPM